MIFGKTKQQEQERLKFLYHNRVRKFAILPRTLTDGRRVWLQWVWVKYPIYRDQPPPFSHYLDGRRSGFYPPQFYLTETDN